jgi:uncharacterized membrane protein
VSFLGIFCILYYQKDKNKIHRAAFVIIVCFGVLTCFVTPILSVHDEGEHLIRAEITSRGELIPKYDPETETYTTIKSINNLFIDWDKKVVTSTYALLPIDYTPYHDPSAFAQNPFYGYLPQSLGIIIAKLLNLSTIWLLWLPRLFNLLFYAILSALAIRKSPILKVPLIVIACIPLTIYQSASVSIDSMVNGLGILIIAYFFYMYKSSDKTIQMKEIFIFFFLCLLIGLCKVPYFALSLLILLIHPKKFKFKKYYYFNVIGILILGILAILWTNSYATPSMVNSWRKGFLIKNNINSTEQISFIKNHFPEFLVSMLQIGNYIENLFSNKASFTGFFNFPLYGSLLVNTIYPLFLSSICFLYPHKLTINVKSRIGSFLTVYIIFVGTYITLLLSWTPVGSINNIWMVQLRYFIPLIPLLPFTFGINNQIMKIERIDNILIVLTIGFLALLPVLTVIKTTMN